MRGVRLLDRGPSAPEHVDRRQRPRRDVLEEGVRLLDGAEYRLGHAVVDVGQRRGHRPAPLDVVRRAALDAPHERQPALVRDVGGLRRPRRDRAEPRRDEDHAAARARRRHVGAVGEQALEDRALLGRRLSLRLDEVPELGGVDREARRPQGGVELVETEVAEGGPPAQAQNDHEAAILSSGPASPRSVGSGWRPPLAPCRADGARRRSLRQTCDPRPDEAVACRPCPLT